MIKDWSAIRYFSKDEWEPGADRTSAKLVEQCDKIRHITGVPMIIHCGWADGGHSTKSYHYTGMAVDFHFQQGKLSQLEQFMAICQVGGFGGIGFYPEWKPCPGWHLDLRPVKDRLFWVRENSHYIYGWKFLAGVLK
jgi:hypothetical protein